MHLVLRADLRFFINVCAFWALARKLAGSIPSSDTIDSGFDMKVCGSKIRQMVLEYSVQDAPSVLVSDEMR